MSRQVIIKLLPVLGSIILFLSWVFQQSLVVRGQDIANTFSGPV